MLRQFHDAGFVWCGINLFLILLFHDYNSSKRKPHIVYVFYQPHTHLTQIGILLTKLVVDTYRVIFDLGSYSPVI